MSLIMSATAAGAQSPPGLAPETGSLIPRKSQKGAEINHRVTDQPTDIAFKLSRLMFACAVKKSPYIAERVLIVASEGRTDEAIKSFSGSMVDCATNVSRRAEALLTYKFNAPTYIGLLAEAWLRSTGGRRLDAIPVVGDDEPTTVETEVSSDGQTVLTKLARCLAGRYPDEVQVVVLTEPSSIQEGQAFQKLSPNLQSCIGQREGLRTNKTGLRLALASAIAERTLGITSTAKAN